MLTTWSVLAVGVGVLVAVVVPGLWLWWPSRRETSSRGELGVALLTGTLIAFAVLAVQVLFELRLSGLESERLRVQAARDAILAREEDRRSLRLTIGLGGDLRRIDLRNRDLRDFHLAQKNLQGARLENARLDDAVLLDADLSDAELGGAHLSGAMLDDARLKKATLSDADLRNASLRGAVLVGADLSRADLRGAKLDDANLKGAALGRARIRGVQYNQKTRWPAGFPVPPCRSAFCTVPGPS